MQVHFRLFDHNQIAGARGLQSNQGRQDVP